MSGQQSYAKQNIVFQASGISQSTYVSPSFIGTPRDFYNMGLGSVDKDWNDILEEFWSCKTPDDFRDTCARVRTYYDIDGWIQTSDERVEEFLPGMALDPRRYENLYFVSAAGSVQLAFLPLSQSHPDIAKQWDYEKNAPLTPDKVSPTSADDAFWVCEKGHKWHSKIVSRTRHNSRCPTCYKLTKTGSSRDLVSVRPDLAAEFHPIRNGDMRPSDVAVGSNKYFWWKCHICGAEWEARPDVRAKSKTAGCSSCKKAAKLAPCMEQGGFVHAL